MNNHKNLIKFMYNANLSLMFLYLKQQDISKDYILSLLEYIKNDSLNQELLYNSFIAGLRFITSSLFYDEILEKIPNLIEEIFHDNEKIFEKKLEYFSLFKRKNITNQDIKYLINSFIYLKEEKANENLEKIFLILNTIKDKRVKNPLIEKIIRYSSDKTVLFKINLNTNLYFLLKDEKYFNELITLLKIQDNDLIIEKIELILDILKKYNDKDYLEKVLNLIINNLVNFSNSEITYRLLINILEFLSIKNFLSNQKEITDKIYIISSNLQNKIYSLKLSISIIVILINNSNFNQATILLNRLFSLLYKLENTSILEIIDFLFLSINKVNYIYKKSFINHIIVHIFNFIDRIIDKSLIPIILNNFLNILSKSNIIVEVKIIFDKIIEILSKNSSEINSNYMTNIVINYIHLINNNKEIINILNKLIYISENLKVDKRLISLLSIAYHKQELCDEIFYYVRKSLENLVDEEYKSLVIKYFTKILLKINDLDKLENNIVKLLNLKINNDFIKTDVYINIAESIIKLQDKNIILLVFNNLLDKIFEIENEFLKVDYIVKLFSFVTNFAKSKDFENILNELIKTTNLFDNTLTKVNMYKSFMVSLLKLGNKYINKLNKEIENTINYIDYGDNTSEIFSVIGTSYYRTGNFSKASKNFNKSLDLLEQINDDNIFFETISNILIRAISTNKTEDLYFIIDKINLLFEILETEEKKFSLFSKILLKLKQLTFINEKYKNDIFKIIDNNINFNNENLKIFSYNNLISICENLNDKDNRNLYISEFISFFNKININPNNIFPLIQFSLVILKGIDKNNSFYIINKIIEQNHLKNYNDAMIFLFKELSFLGNLYVETELINKIINIIKNINNKTLNDRQLYNIALSYIQISNFKDFLEVYSFIKDFNIRNKIQYEVINILFLREDIINLKKFLEYVLDNSNNLDLLLSYIILLSENINYIDDINIFD